MCNFWCLSDLLIIKFCESQKILKNIFKTILDLCYVKFFKPLNEYRPWSKSKTRSKIEKNDEIKNFRKIEIFKFESKFQNKIQKKGNKVKKFSAAARLAAAAHASACEKVSRFEKKKVVRSRNSKTQFWGCFSSFWARTCVSQLK